MGSYKEELDVEEDLKLLRWEWFLERGSWILMFFILLAAVLGFTGRGGLGVSQELAGGPETSIVVLYDEYLRAGATSEMLLTFQKPASESSILFNREFVEQVRIEQIVPQPVSTEIGNKGITFTFNTDYKNAQVQFYLRPKEFGSLQTWLTDGNDVLYLSQYIYP